MTRRPLHPVLFAAYPILFLYAQNLGYVRGTRILPALAGSLVVAALLTLGAARVYGDARKGALASTGLVVLFFSYGHVWHLLEAKAIGPVVVGRDAFLLPLWALLAVGAVVGAGRLRRSPTEATRALNGVAAVLLVLVLVPLGSHLLGQLFGTGTGATAEAAEAASSGEHSDVRVAGQPTEPMRDIYYIVPDRYGDQRTLSEYYGFDNSGFLDSLRRRGFHVPERTVANYPKTAHSLASAMNMRYLDDLAETVGPGSSDRRHVLEMIPGPRLTRFVQEVGYEYHHVGAWWDATADDSTAEVNYHYHPRSEFSLALQRTTLMLPVGKRMGTVYDGFDARRYNYNQLRFQFETLQGLARSGSEEPRFVFAHLLTPHAPYVFHADGRFMSEAEDRSLLRRRAFVQQVMHANAQFEELIDILLSGPEEEHPIIVIMADEGPHPWRHTVEEESFLWTEASEEELERKMGILNALYLPGLEDPGVYPEITSVNVFRLILSRYLGADLPLLPDRAYVFTGEHDLYTFTDVTDRLRRP